MILWLSCHVGIANDYVKRHPKDDITIVPSALSYCFHAGYSERILDSSKSHVVEIYGPAAPAGDQLDRCMEALRPLLFRGAEDSYCNTVYHGQCSIGGKPSHIPFFHSQIIQLFRFISTPSSYGETWSIYWHIQLHLSMEIFVTAYISNFRSR